MPRPHFEFNFEKDVDIDEHVEVRIEKDVDTDVHLKGLLATAEADAQAFNVFDGLAETHSYAVVDPWEGFAISHSSSVAAADYYLG